MNKCKTCKNWKQYSDPKTGYCDYLLRKSNKIKIYPECGLGIEVIDTDPDFGCIHWESKG